jgi:flagellar hook-length control protein FliK
MSIELSGSTSSAKIMAAADSGRDRVKSRNDGDASDEGGFSSILTSLDSSVDEVEDGSKPLKLKSKSSHAGSISSDAAPSLMAQMLPIATMSQESVLAQASMVVSDSMTPAASDNYSEMAMLLAQADRISNNSLNPTSDSAPMGPRGARVTLPGLGSDKPDISTRTLGSLGAGKTVDLKQNNASLLEAATSDVLGQASSARVAELQSAAAASLVESRALTQSFIADTMMREVALSGAQLSGGLADDAQGQAAGSGLASVPKMEGGGVDATWGQPAFHIEAHAGDTQSMVDTSMISPEKTVADTVSYWVTQGVQNAELTLDGFGGESIGVSISLRGDEARIDFRTDQPEVRQVLEGAVAHLKDLLSSEGLVLSGVSVGGSAQDRAGAQDRRNQPDVRQATFVTKESELAEKTPQVNRQAGKGLDIYV